MTRRISSKADDKLRVSAGDHRIGIAAGDHGGGENVAVLVHHALAVAIEHALALQAVIEVLGVVRVVRATGARCGSRCPLPATVRPDLLHRLTDALLAADQDRRAIAGMPGMASAARITVSSSPSAKTTRRGLRLHRPKISSRPPAVGSSRAAQRRLDSRPCR